MSRVDKSSTTSWKFSPKTLASFSAIAILESLTEEMEMSTKFGVAYTSAVTRNRQIAHYPTKLAAAKAACALVYEGANNVTTFKFSDGVGAIDFDWRKVVRFL
jgi:hypothetical protein